eukprot:g10629.t1
MIVIQWHNPLFSVGAKKGLTTECSVGDGVVPNPPLLHQEEDFPTDFYFSPGFVALGYWTDMFSVNYRWVFSFTLSSTSWAGCFGLNMFPNF